MCLKTPSQSGGAEVVEFTAMNICSAHEYGPYSQFWDVTMAIPSS